MRCSLSTMSFDLVWHGVVWMFLVPRSCDNLWNSSDSTVSRHSFWYTIPATYPARNVHAVMYDIISGIGNASHHLENLSTHVNKYDCPSHLGSGPMMSMWMCLNFSPGAGNSPTGACVYRLALVLWHFKNDFVYALTSALIRSKTNMSVNKRTDTLVPGWGKLCTAVKMSLHKDAGTYGRNLPVFVSQMIFSALLGELIYTRGNTVFLSYETLEVLSLLLGKGVDVDRKFQ